MLQAAQLDTLNVLAWQNTKDGAKGRNRPKSILNNLKVEKKESELKGFRTGEDFKQYWKTNGGK